ncbi:hypothetical protein [Haloechinothrix sp. LS1_15]|uniref:hypothetical protein n=1 Tax=Haloechinothrix sp. LS1_15 TaxID=2652248 RepID=UPI002946E5E7|nr:hypothetical protein [Haloechinothrix sp. LS1_15]MDV6011972.1 hypothetical protein [Haloechinothrix sp. LS1_15]
MSEPGGASNNSEAATTNAAGAGSTIGIQANEVRDSTVYQVLPDMSPSRKYEVGLRYLEDGVPSRARELIHEAIAHGHENGEVRFHWMLAMLSKRSYRDLAPSDREKLSDVSTTLHKYDDDEWKHALGTICELLSCLNDPRGDPRLALEKLHAVSSDQRDKIVRHLDLVITGGMKDALWADTRRAAANGRLGGNRLDRVWAYFYPDPIDARTRRPTTIATSAVDRNLAMMWSGVFAIAIGYLGWSVLAQASMAPILAYLGAIASGFLGARTGYEWRYRTSRLHAKEQEFFGRRRINRAPDGGFTRKVERSFEYYFNKYVPPDADRDEWLARTAGIRNTLRDEVSEIYRESRVDIARVNWLIRHLVNDIKKRWKSGTLFDFYETYRTALSTKLWCVLAVTAFIPTSMTVVIMAIQSHPLTAALATLVALTTGRTVAVRWMSIVSEKRRFAEECREYQRNQEERQAAYQRWKKRLKSTRPSEQEMETWLNCDKTALLDDALLHYGLAWRDIIAHTFLQVPTPYCKRTRVKGGPWRYSKYDLRLFLITDDGVREFGTELDFERASFHGLERNNFRFDAVSSVHVTHTSERSYTLNLTLMNGPTRSIRVTDPIVPQPDSDEDPDAFAQMNLDAAGFTHTLHILEGIAAEGKGWIDRDPHVHGQRNDPAQRIRDSQPHVRRPTRPHRRSSRSTR